MKASVWVVGVMTEDEDEVVYGPYTERQAKRVAAKIQDEADAGRDLYGGCHHPLSVTGAIPFPLGRYDRFLSTEEKKEMRAEKRIGDRQYG